MEVTTPFAALAQRWRDEAAVVGKYDVSLGKVLTLHADELEAAEREAGAVPLTLSQAAAESGYSPDRLRHLVSSGQVANAGRRGAPRIRRADLPHKPGRGSGFDAEAAARRNA